MPRKQPWGKYGVFFHFDFGNKEEDKLKLTFRSFASRTFHIVSNTLGARFGEKRKRLYLKTLKNLASDVRSHQLLSENRDIATIEIVGRGEWINYRSMKRNSLELCAIDLLESVFWRPGAKSGPTLTSFITGIKLRWRYSFLARSPQQFYSRQNYFMCLS